MVLPEGLGLAVRVMVLMGWSALYSVSTAGILKVEQTAVGIHKEKSESRNGERGCSRRRMTRHFPFQYLFI
jgi:hypothetical protein